MPEAGSATYHCLGYRSRTLTQNHNPKTKTNPNPSPKSNTNVCSTKRHRNQVQHSVIYIYLTLSIIKLLTVRSVIWMYSKCKHTRYLYSTWNQCGVKYINFLLIIPSIWYSLLIWYYYLYDQQISAVHQTLFPSYYTVWFEQCFIWYCVTVRLYRSVVHKLFRSKATNRILKTIGGASQLWRLKSSTVFTRAT